MGRYQDYVIKNTCSGKFAVVCRREGVDRLAAWMVYDTYAEAYATAKAYLFGQIPTDETSHH